MWQTDGVDVRQLQALVAVAEHGTFSSAAKSLHTVQSNISAHVARLELELAFRYLLPRLEEVELAGPVDRLTSNLVGGIKRLPIRYKLRRA